MTARTLALPALWGCCLGCVVTAASVRSAEVAPPPRAVEDTRVYLSDFKRNARTPDDGEKSINGLEWRVSVATRKLVSTGREVIDLHWRLKYSGPRPPLIILRPSITDSWAGATEARIHAFPPGEEKGRVIVFTVPFEAGNASRHLFNGPPGEWFLRVPKGRAATGTESVFVTEVKERLRSQYPAEFPADRPPKLYATLYHNAWDRGWHLNLDAWTGEIESFPLEVPDLKTW